MTLERFTQLWTALVTDRQPASEDASCTLTNGVSEDTIDALLKAADDDFSDFEEIQAKFDKRDAAVK
ncbi:MAG TPA: hypothetical protein VFE31_08335 [Opitutaceae bacterium]|nr:hypothetical protein [Opitutaceae bacterium]